MFVTNSFKKKCHRQLVGACSAVFFINAASPVINWLSKLYSFVRRIKKGFTSAGDLLLSVTVNYLITSKEKRKI